MHFFIIWQTFKKKNWIYLNKYIKTPFFLLPSPLTWKKKKKNTKKIFFHAQNTLFATKFFFLSIKVRSDHVQNTLLQPIFFFPCPKHTFLTNFFFLVSQNHDQNAILQPIFYFWERLRVQTHFYIFVQDNSCPLMTSKCVTTCHFCM